MHGEEPHGALFRSHHCARARSRSGTTGSRQAGQGRSTELRCSGGVGLALGSHKLVSCSFTSEREGSREEYDGSITKYGLDLGLTHGSWMPWIVPTNTIAGPGFLTGDYFGATGEATVGAGLGANVLLGGSNPTVALQPLSRVVRRA